MSKLTVHQEVQQSLILKDILKAEILLLSV